MLNLATVKFIISFITFLMAYMVAVTIGGFFRAWVAKRAGDDTAEHMGFLTVNPFAHMDFMGTIFIALFGFGWGRYIPVNPFAIHEPWRKFKLVAIYLSDSFAYFICAMMGIVTLVIACGPKMLYTAYDMLVYVQCMSHVYLAQECPALSTFSITLAFIVISFISQCVILCVLDLILNGFSLVLLFIFSRSSEYETYNSFMVILVPILIIFFLSTYLRMLAIHVIMKVGFIVAAMLGMA